MNIFGEESEVTMRLQFALRRNHCGPRHPTKNLDLDTYIKTVKEHTVLKVGPGP